MPVVQGNKTISIYSCKLCVTSVPPNLSLQPQLNRQTPWEVVDAELTPRNEDKLHTDVLLTLTPKNHPSPAPPHPPTLMKSSKELPLMVNSNQPILNMHLITVRIPYISRTLTLTIQIQRTIKRIEPLVPNLGRNKLVRKANSQSRKTPKDSSNRGSNKSTKHRPIIRVETFLEKNEISTLSSVAVVDRSEEEDGEDSTQTTHNNLEAAPEVELVVETNAKNWNHSGGDKIGDEVYLKDGQRSLRDDDNRKDEENHTTTDEPDVESVAEEIVGCC